MVGTAGIDHKIKTIKHQGKLMKVEIWDTAGQEKYRSLTRRYYEGVSGVILVFDVCDESSLQNLNQYWLPKILENADENIDLAIVGNKTDLINEREVDQKDVDKFLDVNQYIKANQRLSDVRKKENYTKTIINSTNYYEASAKEPENVDKIFKALLTTIVKNKKLKEKILMANQPER